MFVILTTLSSAFLISDQGTNVITNNGSILENGDLKISIYDESSGGNTIFSSTISDAIVNGSWNLMVNADLEYGKIYWKDYEINGEDLDFDGEERLEFQSSVGMINDVNFINLSLISSCPNGEAIQIIYSNGSVGCTTASGGNVSGGSTDLTNYALKNQSENFSGNITTTQTGLFGWLGSLANRITKLFVQDIDASGNIAASGNVSATYLLGDGSLITNLPSAGAESDPIFIAENSTLWNSINSRLTQSDQRYNDTALIISINNNANIRSLGFYNISEVNTLVSGISGGNLSFNQSLTNSLYYPITNPYSFVNITSNETTLVLSVNRTSNIMALGFYNTTQVNSLISSIGNSSFNQSLTNSLYYSINNPLNFVNTTSNETTLVLSVNSTIWNYINSNQNGWNSTFNSTYHKLLGSQCPSGYFVNGTLLNGTLTCAQTTQGESDPLWTANASSVLYSVSLPLTNRTIVSINNVTGFFYNYNETVASVNQINGLFWNKTQSYNKTEIDSFNSSWTSTYNATYAANIANNSWNQTLANNLYSNISWNYNQTTAANSYTNLVNSSLATWIDSLFVKIVNVFNRTEIQAQYYNKSEIVSLGYVNSTGLSSYNETNLILGVNQSLIALKLNITDQRYNETNLIIGVNSSGNIQSLGFYNATQVNSLINGISNSSFNQSLTNSLYYSINNPLSFINSTQVSIYNDTTLINGINQTLMAVKLNLTDQRYNETTIILSINSTNNIQSLGFYNTTQVNSLIANIGNSTFNQSLTNGLYYSISNPYNFLNNTTASAYNDSILVFSVNSSLWNMINGNQNTWNSTYNSTYNSLVGQQCTSGQVVNGTLLNGTIVCTTVSSSGAVNPFNQVLNTTSNVTFGNITGGSGFFTFLGSLTSRITRIFASDIDVSNNISVGGNISAQYYIGSLNRSTFPTSTCSGTNKVIGVLSNGTVICGSDETGSSSDTKFMNILAGAVTDTNAPTAERIVGNSQYLVCTNATGYTKFRYGIARSATNGASSSIVYIKYIAAPTTSITGSSYTNLSTSGPQTLSYTTQNLATVSQYYSMDNDLDDICIGAFQRGGDGTLDPQWRNIWVELS
jgi:hypothetical protein